MARRRRKRIQRRDAKVSTPSLTVRLSRSKPVAVLELRPVEDRRRFHPLGVYRPARRIDGRAVSRHVVDDRRSRGRYLPTKIKFAVPRATAICIRRRRRKEVLHAKQLVGGGRGRRAPRRNWFSEVRC